MFCLEETDLQGLRVPEALSFIWREVPMIKMLIALALVISCSTLVKPNLIMTPKTTEVLVGDSTFLNCSTSILSAEIHWFHYAAGLNADRSFVYGYDQFYPPYQGRLRMEKDESSGKYNLVILSATMEDAGRYECQDDDGRGSKDTADLVVLDENPVCQSNIKANGIVGPNSCGLEPEELLLSCLVLYHGSQPPIMIWKTVGTESPITKWTFQNVSDDRVIYYLKMGVNSRMDGSSYRCQTTRSASAQYYCTSETVKVIGTESSSVAIYCVLAVILIVATVVSFTVGWYLHVLRVKRTAAKKTRDCLRQENHPLVKGTIENDSQSAAEIQQERERLTVKVHELEQRLYEKINYIKSPTLVHSIIPTTAEKEKSMITGMAIIELKLFAAYENSKTVEVYDSQTFIAKRPLNIEELVDPQDLVSSQLNHCLHIVNRVGKDSNCEILTFDASGTISKKWPTEGHSVRLSTCESNIIACISDKRLVLEYSSEGKLVKTVKLSPAAGFEHLWHAIKLTGSNFAVSHKKVDEDRHRVCIVDSNGDVLYAFEELPFLKYGSLLNSGMNFPICLAGDRDKSILVADSAKARLLLLSSTLEFEKELVTLKSGCTVRICLDETNGRIFVAENDDKKKQGRISIFNVIETRRS